MILSYIRNRELGYKTSLLKTLNMSGLDIIKIRAYEPDESGYYKFNNYTDFADITLARDTDTGELMAEFTLQNWRPKDGTISFEISNVKHTGHMHCVPTGFHQSDPRGLQLEYSNNRGVIGRFKPYVKSKRWCC